MCVALIAIYACRFFRVNVLDIADKFTKEWLFLQTSLSTIYVSPGSDRNPCNPTEVSATASKACISFFTIICCNIFSRSSEN